MKTSCPIEKRAQPITPRLSAVALLITLSLTATLALVSCNSHERRAASLLKRTADQKHDLEVWNQKAAELPPQESAQNLRGGRQYFETLEALGAALDASLKNQGKLKLYAEYFGAGALCVKIFLAPGVFESLNKKCVNESRADALSCSAELQNYPKTVASLFLTLPVEFQDRLLAHDQCAMRVGPWLVEQFVASGSGHEHSYSSVSKRPTF